MDEKISYKNILVEVRPRLQSLNVIINLNEPLEVSNFDICYKNEKIIICNDDGKKLIIPFDKIDVVPDKVGNIQMTNEYVTFKYFTKNKNFGSFNVEILRHKIPDIPKNIVGTFIREDENYKLECGNCTQSISDEISFNRVLPLPSEFLEAGNFFCHGNSENKFSLDPRINDVFYTESYVHLNSKLFRNIIEDKPNLICKRCFAWLGTIISENTFRFWYNTISFTNGDEKNITNPLEDSYNIIKSVSRNSLLNTAKVILSCQISKNRSDFILLWILEKELNVVLRDDGGDYRDLNVAKVLFKFVSDGNELVDQWTNDMTTPTVHVSKPMMSRLMENLSKMNKLLPRDFASSIGFFVSYLPLYDS